MRTVVIICIDHREWFLHHIAAAQHRMAGAPGLFPPLRHSIACRQCIQLLVNILHRHMGSHRIADLLLERFLNRVLDHKHHLAKAGAQGVIDGIIHQLLPGGADRCDLLQPAKAAAHPGSHNDQCWLHVSFPSLCVRSFPTADIILLYRTKNKAFLLHLWGVIAQIPYCQTPAGIV